MIDKPRPAKIILTLKDGKTTGEQFISLSTILYQQNLIYDEPRELRRVGDNLELILTFRDNKSSKDWKQNKTIKKYYDEKFKALINGQPKTKLQRDVILEVDKVRLCDCKKSSCYFLQGRSLGIYDNELNCGDCLGQVSYSTLPIDIEIENWQRHHRRTYLNYIESDFLEKKALKELMNHDKGVLNKEGQKVRRQLATFFKKPVYYLYFATDESPDSLCPICKTKGKLTGHGRPYKICKKCDSAFGAGE
jgi:hypothetical protein